VTRILFNVAIWSVILWVFTRLHLPVESLFYNALQNSGHGIAFFVLTFFAMASFSHRLRRIRVLTLVVSVILFLLGATIELVQQLSGRGGSFSDLVMNGSGIVSGGIAYCLFKAKLNWTVRLPLAILAIGSIAWAIHKPAVFAFAEFIEKPLPTLNDFNAMGSGIKLLPRHTEIDIGNHAQVWPENSSQSLKVSFGRGLWPSVVFQEPPLSWCDYDTFVFDVYSPMSKAVRLYVRIDDESINFPDHSFMTARRMIEPGAGQVIIYFDDLADDARERGMPTFNDMSGFQLFMPGNNDRPKVLYFDDFKLMKSGTSTRFDCVR